MRTRTLIAVAALIVALTVVGAFKSPLYGLCLSADICSHPRLPGVDIRMKPEWLPELYSVDGNALLSFAKNGRGISERGEVVKFRIDPASAKTLAPFLTPRQFSWGGAMVGNAGQEGKERSNRMYVHYLVVPELNLIAVGTNTDAFEDIVRVTRITPMNATAK